MLDGIGSRVQTDVTTRKTLDSNDQNQVADQRFSLKQWFAGGAQSRGLRKRGCGHCKVFQQLPATSGRPVYYGKDTTHKTLWTYKIRLPSCFQHVNALLSPTETIRNARGWPQSRHQSLGSTQGSGKLYLGEHAPWGSYSQKLAIWTLLRLLTPRANMNAPIRNAFDCCSRKPTRRHFVSGFPRALLSLSQEKSSGDEIGVQQLPNNTQQGVKKKTDRKTLNNNDHNQVFWARETEHPQQTVVLRTTAGQQPGSGQCCLRSSVWKQTQRVTPNNVGSCWPKFVASVCTVFHTSHPFSVSSLVKTLLLIFHISTTYKFMNNLLADNSPDQQAVQ